MRANVRTGSVGSAILTQLTSSSAHSAVRRSSSVPIMTVLVPASRLGHVARLLRREPEPAPLPDGVQRDALVRPDALPAGVDDRTLLERLRARAAPGTRCTACTARSRCPGSRACSRPAASTPGPACASRSCSSSAEREQRALQPILGHHVQHVRLVLARVGRLAQQPALSSRRPARRARSGRSPRSRRRTGRARASSASNLMNWLQRTHGFGVRPRAYSPTKSLMTFSSKVSRKFIT